MLKVFRDKKCTIAIDDPKVHSNGFVQDGSGAVSQVFYDKGGRERLPRDSQGRGGSFIESSPAWVTREEHERRKEGRVRAWKKSKEGQDDYFARRQSEKSREGRYERLYPYGGEPPHAWA